MTIAARSRSRSASMKAMASSLPARRPWRRRTAVSKLWTPIEMRLAPASRQASTFSASKWMMRPSMVISQSGASGSVRRIVAINRDSSSADSALGVPPPR
jgi:hypothetical protein